MRETPWLIQRMNLKETTVPSPSIDELLSFDYMGSAEFEFGALPKSLKQMTSVVDDIEVFGMKQYKAFDGKMICLICTKEQFEIYKEFIPGLIDDKYRLKEWTKLRDRIQGEMFGSPLREDQLKMAWWDIDFNVMFCMGKEEARKILKSIKVVRDRKKKSKEEGWY